MVRETAKMRLRYSFTYHEDMSTEDYTHIVRASSADEAKQVAKDLNLPSGSWFRLPFTIDDSEPAVYQRILNDEVQASEIESLEDQFKLFLIVSSSMAVTQELATDLNIPKRAWGSLVMSSLEKPLVYKMIPSYATTV